MKHVGKKLVKLGICNIPSPKRDITHSNFDKIRRNVNLTCESSLQNRIQNFINTSKHVEKYYNIILLVQKRGITHSKIDKIRRKVNLICKLLLQSHTQCFIWIPQSMSKKVRKTTCMCNIPSPKKEHNSFKIWWNHTKLKLDLWLIITKTYTKFQLNTSKHVEKSAENYLYVIFQVQKGA